MKEKIPLKILQEALKVGIKDFCICPGARNAVFISLLKQESFVKPYYFYDERSAVFFALGKSRADQRPAAIITTSGTAAAHLLAGAMEAYYTGTPLLLITADRPKRFRGSNAPQACEQKNLYGIYTPFALDLDEQDEIDLSRWDRSSPAHINVCLEEPTPSHLIKAPLLMQCPITPIPKLAYNPKAITAQLEIFFSSVDHPLVVVGTLKQQARKPIVDFLVKLNAPIYAEAVSGLREEERLKHLHIYSHDKIWEYSSTSGYLIDGILRIGGVPTLRLWRDLEYKEGQIKVYSINEEPFSGLSWSKSASVPLVEFFEQFSPTMHYSSATFAGWKEKDERREKQVLQYLQQEPASEPGLIHALSQKMQKNCQVFLGNSLPIREWDLAAVRNRQDWNVFASRGLNGIDGQISTFWGLCKPSMDNWALIGDLTALHDLSGPWILPQLGKINATLVVINNGGGKIFSMMFSDAELQNNHTLNFRAIAQMWNLEYDLWNEIPGKINSQGIKLIELCPDEQASKRIYQLLKE